MEEYIGIIVFIIFVVISVIANALKKTVEKGKTVERYRGYRGLLFEKPPTPSGKERGTVDAKEQPPVRELPPMVEEERRAETFPLSYEGSRLQSSIGDRRIGSMDASSFSERLKRIFGEDSTSYEEREQEQAGGFPPFEGMSEWARLIAFHTVFERKSPLARRYGLRR